MFFLFFMLMYPFYNISSSIAIININTIFRYKSPSTNWSARQQAAASIPYFSVKKILKISMRTDKYNSNKVKSRVNLLLFYVMQMPFLTPILTPIVMIYNDSKWCKMIWNQFLIFWNPWKYSKIKGFDSGLDGSRTRVRNTIPCPSTSVVYYLTFPLPAENKHPAGFSSFMIRPYAQSFA